MLHLETIECKPLRPGNEWKLIAVSFGAGFLMGVVTAILIGCSI